MSLRTFRAEDGSRWSVWQTEARSASRYADGPRTCLAFVDHLGIERARLFDVPPHWEELSVKRLEILLGYAERIGTAHRVDAAMSPPIVQRLVERVD